MSDTTSELVLLASGRDADVYALDDATVLRRVRNPEHSRTRDEAKIMAYVAEYGYPVPRVHHVDDDSMVMQRLDGPTLLENLFRRPWTLRANARILAGLHDALAAIPAPDWLPPAEQPAQAESGPEPGPELRAGSESGLESDAGSDSSPGAGSAQAQAQEPAGPFGSVLHLDLHPGNVIITADGPVVIDWTNAASGPAALDLAKTLVTLTTVDLPGWPQRLVCDLYTWALRRAAHTDPSPGLAPALRVKLQDPNLSETESARVRTMLERETRS
ncbi:aminoglycoside phosphotransferase family protein [Actinospica durhamensis]|uniref:Aminoglycoside phosphotransferase family protein n=1 Tax=Actinospica durhamensis TaxID=1508375 RepID=A0A941IV42_9ACTN|nr:aminoglycoside phosphotransferase family protein [Actinospica durhamensis]MBR7838513.1 aminoglycoside phosphotransferase family protein [Actinospica durhamensis]